MSVFDILTGLTLILFAALSLVMRRRLPGYAQAPRLARSAIAAGFAAMMVLGLLIFLQGTTGYQAPNVRTALYTLWALGIITWVLVSRRSRTNDRHG